MRVDEVPESLSRIEGHREMRGCRRIGLTESKGFRERRIEGRCEERSIGREGGLRAGRREVVLGSVAVP